MITELITNVSGTTSVWSWINFLTRMFAQEEFTEFDFSLHRSNLTPILHVS